MVKRTKLLTIALCFGLMMGSLVACGNEVVGSVNEVVEHNENVELLNGVANSESQIPEKVEDDGILVLAEVIMHNADGTSYTSEVYKYDDKGNMINLLGYTEEGKCWRTEYQYNNSGKLLKEYTYSIDGDLVIGYEHEYAEDETLMKTMWYDYKNEEWIIEFEQRYDDMGNLIYYVKRSDLSPYSNSYTLEEYYYDDKGNVIKENRKYHYGYESTREVNQYIEYIYNEDNLLVESLYYDENGVLEYRYVHDKYDTNGRILSEYQYVYNDPMIEDQGINEYKFEYEYDSQGKLLSKYQCSVEGEILIRMDFEYTEGTNYCKAYEYRLYFGGGEYADNVYECEFDEKTGRVINFISIPWGIDAQTVGNFYEFDKAGRIIKVERHTTDNKVIMLSANEYDEQGNLIKESIGEDSHIYTNVYDSQGKLIQYISKYQSEDTEDRIYCNIYEYDNGNNMVKMTATNNGELDYWEEYIYKKIIISE